MEGAARLIPNVLDEVVRPGHSGTAALIPVSVGCADVHCMPASGQNDRTKMSKALTRATFKVVLPGLFVGGLFGAAVGLDWLGPGLGIGGAVGVALLVGLSVLRIRRRFNKGVEGSSASSDL